MLTRDNDEDPYLAVACWMQELGRRRYGVQPRAWAAQTITRARSNARRNVLQALTLSALLTAYFQYYFLDVLLQIAMTRSIIVFVLQG